MMLTEIIKQELEKDTLVLRETEDRIARCRDALDKDTALYMGKAGEIKGIRRVLRIIEEEEAKADPMGVGLSAVEMDALKNLAAEKAVEAEGKP